MTLPGEVMIIYFSVSKLQVLYSSVTDLLDENITPRHHQKVEYQPILLTHVSIELFESKFLKGSYYCSLDRGSSSS